MYRDFSAGLIVALTAIPMAMGFAIASGLRPEQGIIAGALACIVGRTFGGSKYQVYGPTAAFIPVVAGLMAKYGEVGRGTFDQGHGFHLLVSIIAGVTLMVMGLLGLGKYAKLVPDSIVVGFTVGIAIVIAMSNFGEALGVQLLLKGGLFEKVLCSTMADRLADNRKTKFNAEKELWGQGIVQVITPLVNGFPCTGALARTTTSIKAGAVTPLAGYFKGVLKLVIVLFLASYLEYVPMACIAGILLWVATNMVKPKEIKEVWGHNKFHASLMIYTAAMVPLTDFLTGVLSALIIYAVLVKFLDTPAAVDEPTTAKKPDSVDKLQSDATPAKQVAS